MRGSYSSRHLLIILMIKIIEIYFVDYLEVHHCKNAHVYFSNPQNINPIDPIGWPCSICLNRPKTPGKTTIFPNISTYFQKEEQKVFSTSRYPMYQIDAHGMDYSVH